MRHGARVDRRIGARPQARTWHNAATRPGGVSGQVAPREVTSIDPGAALSPNHSRAPAHVRLRCSSCWQRPSKPARPLLLLPSMGCLELVRPAYPRMPRFRRAPDTGAPASLLEKPLHYISGTIGTTEGQFSTRRGIEIAVFQAVEAIFEQTRVAVSFWEAGMLPLNHARKQAARNSTPRGCPVKRNMLDFAP